MYITSNTFVSVTGDVVHIDFDQSPRVFFASRWNYTADVVSGPAIGKIFDIRNDIGIHKVSV